MTTGSRYFSNTLMIADFRAHDEHLAHALLASHPKEATFSDSKCSIYFTHLPTLFFTVSPILEVVDAVPEGLSPALLERLAVASDPTRLFWPLL